MLVRPNPGSLAIAIDLDEHGDRDIPIEYPLSDSASRVDAVYDKGQVNSAGSESSGAGNLAWSNPHRVENVTNAVLGEPLASRSVETVAGPCGVAIIRAATSIDLAVFRWGRRITPCESRRRRNRTICAPFGRRRAKDMACPVGREVGQPHCG